MIIKNKEELEEWLDQNYWFEDGYVSKIEGEPDGTLRITVGYEIEGTYVAGESQKLKEFEISPKNVSKWTYSKEHPFSPSHEWCIKGIDLADDGLGLKFETPYIFEMVCSTLEISNPRIIEGYTQPWTSDRGIYIVAPHREVPTPAYWIKELKKSGLEGSFRYYCGAAKGVNELPYPDYSGYYIQATDRIEESQEGIFFNAITNEKNELRISLELKDEESGEVWRAILRIFSNWENIKISCGNVVFEQAEWSGFLETGRYPERIEKIKTTIDTGQP